MNWNLLPLRVVLLAALLAAGVGCRSTKSVPDATAVATLESVSYGPLAARTFVTPEYFHWVDLQGEFVLGAGEAANRHFMALEGDAMEFTESPAPTVSADDTKVLVGVRSGGGRPGVLLVRSDGSSMGMYVFQDHSTTFGDVGFAPWVGLTLVGTSDSAGSRVVALNNYARIVFDLPMQDYRGRLVVAPDLSHVALVRDGEVELAPLQTRGETIVIREGMVSPEGRDLYREALRLVERW